MFKMPTRSDVRFRLVVIMMVAALLTALSYAAYNQSKIMREKEEAARNLTPAPAAPAPVLEEK